MTASWAGDGGSGEPLPPDGGAPFAAYLEYVEAVHAGDWETFSSMASPETFDEMVQFAGGQVRIYGFPEDLFTDRFEQ